jgi:hypothetical protein
MMRAKFIKSVTGSARLAATAAIALAAIFGSANSYAAKFANQFVEFELPPQWQCNLEGAEWVCQSLDEQKKRDAIIVLAAKLKGDQDSLDQYLAYLKNPKTYNNIKGSPVTSTPKYAKNIRIGDHDWVDSLHMASEIPDFYTRYLATVKNDIGVLVTYSINKNKYAEYQPQFENMVNTLKVFRKPGAPLNGGTNLFGINVPKPDDTTVFNSNLIPGGENKPKKAKDDLPIEYIMAGVVLVAFIIWRRKKASGG